jgi:hypothetical protein
VRREGGLTTDPCVANAVGSDSLSRRTHRDSQVRLERPLEDNDSEDSTLAAFRRLSDVIRFNSEDIACPISSGPIVLDGLTLNQENFECVDSGALETCGSKFSLDLRQEEKSDPFCRLCGRPGFRRQLQ